MTEPIPEPLPGTCGPLPDSRDDADLVTPNRLAMTSSRLLELAFSMEERAVSTRDGQDSIAQVAVVAARLLELAVEWKRSGDPANVDPMRDAGLE